MFLVIITPPRFFRPTMIPRFDSHMRLWSFLTLPFLPFILCISLKAVYSSQTVLYAPICATIVAKRGVPWAKHGTADATLLFASFNTIEIRDWFKIYAAVGLMPPPKWNHGR